jgi:hypothetical protein
MTNRFEILANCKTYENWTVDDEGNAEAWYSDSDGVEEELYYVHDNEGEFSETYFSTFEEAKAELERLTNLTK